MKLLNIIGLLIILSLFIGILIIIWKQDGIRAALMVFGTTFLIVVGVFLGVYLMTL